MKLKPFFSVLIFLCCGLFGQATANNTSPPIKILFLGDSLTEGYGIQHNKAYADIVAEKLKTNYPNKNIVVIKNGINGSTSASALGRLKWQLRAPIKPKILVLALGANDGLRGLKTSSIYENLSKAIELAQNNKIIVVLAGMKALPNYGKKYVAEYDKVFSNLHNKYSPVFMPFLLKDVAGISKHNISDGIHPNEIGHQLIANNLYPFIKQAIALTNE